MAITPKQILEKIAAQRDAEQDEVKRLEMDINEFLEDCAYVLASDGEIGFDLSFDTEKETIETLLTLYRGAGWKVESTSWPDGLPSLTFTCPEEFYQNKDGTRTISDKEWLEMGGK